MLILNLHERHKNILIIPSLNISSHTGLGNSNQPSAAGTTAPLFNRKSVTQPTSATDLENILGPSPIPSSTTSTDAFAMLGSQPVQQMVG